MDDNSSKMEPWEQLSNPVVLISLGFSFVMFILMMATVMYFGVNKDDKKLKEPDPESGPLLRKQPDRSGLKVANVLKSPPKAMSDTSAVSKFFPKPSLAGSFASTAGPVPGTGNGQSPDPSSVATAARPMNRKYRERYFVLKEIR
ncbi:hypothetical protein HDE_06569 [Halotydeus destructor]|nr:hypothetical protein HDE_06569 [Halotydeus destructor]